MGGASKQIQAKKMKKEKEAVEAAKKAAEEVRYVIFSLVFLYSFLPVKIEVQYFRASHIEGVYNIYFLAVYGVRNKVLY